MEKAAIQNQFQTLNEQYTNRIDTAKAQLQFLTGKLREFHRANQTMLTDNNGLRQQKLECEEQLHRLQEERDGLIERFQQAQAMLVHNAQHDYLQAQQGLQIAQERFNVRTS